MVKIYREPIPCSAASIRKVSRVSAQATRRNGAHIVTGRRCIEWNRKLQEAARCSQISTAVNDKSVSCPRNFGLESGGSFSSGIFPMRAKNRISTSSRFGNTEMKWDSWRAEQCGDSSVSDRSVGDRCPKYRPSPGINL